MSDWRKRAIPVGEAQPEAPKTDGGFVKMADTSTKDGRIEARIADLNTKRGKEESDSNARIGLLERILAASQTGSLNLGDELSGVRSAIQGKGYRAGQQPADREAKAAQDKHPLASLAGVAPMMLVPGAQGAPARVGLAALLGGVNTAASQPGEISLRDTGEIGKGSAISGGVQLGLEAASPLLGKMAQMLRRGSDSQSARAMGFRGGISNKARNMGLSSEDDVADLGKFAMDEGLVPILGSKKVAQENSRGLANQLTNAQQSTLDEATLAGGFQPALSAAKMRGALTDLNPAQARSIGPAAKAVEDVDALAQGVNPGDFRVANSTKASHQGQTNWGDVPNLSDAQKLMRRATTAEKEAIEEQVSALLGQDRGDFLRGTNQKIGKALKLEEVAKEAATRESQNRVFGLPETILAASGLAGGGAAGQPLSGAVAGGTLALLSNLAKTRGSGPGAYALKGAGVATDAASGLNQLPAAVATLTPDEEQRQRLLRLLAKGR